MKYDTNTANVDRWHGMSQDELAQGYGNCPTPDTNNNRQLDGGKQPRDGEPISKQSD